MKTGFIPLLLLLGALLSIPMDLFGQAGTVEVQGQVFDEDGVSPLPFAHVLSKKWATTTNVSGLFKVPLEEDDTIRISFVGFKDYRFTVPSDYREDEYELDVTMVRDTIYLREAEIFFLPENEEDFKEAILALELNDKEYTYAMRNINLLKRQMKIANYDKDAMDASENARYYLSGPQPVYFNFVFDKIREAMHKSRGRRRALPELEEINPSAFAVDNNLAGISAEEQKQFADTLSIKSDSTFQYILKQPVKENRRK